MVRCLVPAEIIHFTDRVVGRRPESRADALERVVVALLSQSLHAAVPASPAPAFADPAATTPDMLVAMADRCAAEQRAVLPSRAVRFPANLSR